MNYEARRLFRKREMLQGAIDLLLIHPACGDLRKDLQKELKEVESKIEKLVDDNGGVLL